jgi:hypothetical protein
MIDKTTGRGQASVRFTQGTTDLVLLDARAAVQRPACLDLGAVLTRALYEVWTRRSHTHVVYTSGPCWAMFVIYALVVFRLSLGYRGSESQHPPKEGCSHQLEGLAPGDVATGKSLGEGVEGAPYGFFGHRGHPFL